MEAVTHDKAALLALNEKAANGGDSEEPKLSI